MTSFSQRLKELAENTLLWRVIGIVLILGGMLTYGLATTEPVRIVGIALGMLGVFVKGTLIRRPAGCLLWIAIMLLSLLGGVLIIRVDKWVGLSVHGLALLLVPSPLHDSVPKHTTTPIEQG